MRSGAKTLRPLDRDPSIAYHGCDRQQAKRRATMANITLTASDGFELGAYRADPAGALRGGIVVIQEIFGVNSHIRSICDRLAADGYAAIAPAIFDRSERDFQSGYSPAEIERARGFLANPDWDAFLRDTDAARAALADTGKVGIVGFCLGGSIAFMAATRLDGYSAAVGFYGGRIAEYADETPRCPTQLHYGSEDHGIPMSNVNTVKEKRPDVDIFVYEGAGHGFNCDARASYDADAAKLAWGRTMDFFAEHLG
jgi:carboxymethylenebutenolidase